MCLTAPINCDRANVVAAKVQQPLHNQTYISVKEPRKEKIATLATLHSTLKMDNEVVDIDPLILFSQLILLAEREEEATPCFVYMSLQITRFHPSRIV